jgi:hypothetical protein
MNKDNDGNENRNPCAGPFAREGFERNTPSNVGYFLRRLHEREENARRQKDNDR